MAVRATINDIAERVGVDKSTVSLVLRNKKAAMRISERTQKRVFSAAKELKYRPNILARGLKGGQTHSIGIVWDMSVAQASVLMTRDLMVKIRKHQYVPNVIDDQGDINKALEALSDFENRGIDGVILELGSPNLSREEQERLTSQVGAFKASVVICKSPMTFLGIDQIVHDRYEAIQAVADYFVRTGRTQPSMISADYIIGAKTKVFSSRFKEHGVGLAKENIIYLKNISGLSYGYQLADYCYKALDAKFSDGEVSFDSLLCSADEEAIAAIAWLNSKGLQVPHEVAVVGFNNYGSSKYAIPPLASIERRDHDVADIAEKMLFARLGNPDLPIQRETVSMGFVWRESAG